MNKLRNGLLVVSAAVFGVIASASAAGAAVLPDPSDTADTFLTDNAPEAVSIILSVAGAAILIGLIGMGVTRVRATLTKGR